MNETSSSSTLEGTDDTLLVELADTITAVGRRLQVGVHGLEDVVPLTGTEISVLRWIDRHPGATPSATADATGLRRPNLSAALRLLGEKGMITREPDAHDSRSVHLFATDLARECGRRALDRLGSELGRRIPALDEADRAALRRTLELLADADGPTPEVDAPSSTAGDIAPAADSGGH